MKAYKGFSKDMKCRDFQFREGMVYTEEDARLCGCGFHACLDPADCFDYYSPALSVYHEVELYDVCGERSNDTKVCAKGIKIGRRLSMEEMFRRHMDHVRYFGIGNGERKQYGNNAHICGVDNFRVEVGHDSDVAGDDCVRIKAGNRLTAVCGTLAEVECGYGSHILCGSRAEVKCGRGSYVICGERSAVDVSEIFVYLKCGMDTTVRFPVNGEDTKKAVMIDGKKYMPDKWYEVRDGELLEVKNMI